MATVRACYGESSLLHGVEWMPPKVFIALYLWLQLELSRICFH